MLRAELHSAQMSKIINGGWHRMLYSCTHMATVGVRWLTFVMITWFVSVWQFLFQFRGGTA